MLLKDHNANYFCMFLYASKQNKATGIRQPEYNTAGGG